MKRTKAFFRDDGLVIEWYVLLLLCLCFTDACLIRKSDVPVWNDTLLPERPQSQSTPSKMPPCDVSSTSANSETLKRKRDVIDVDALPSASLPSKKSRPSEPQKTPSPKKGKAPGSASSAKHWSAGLSPENVRRLGRGVEVAPLKRLSPLAVAPRDIKEKRASDVMVGSVASISPPPKRPALPTRLTPAERKAVSAPYSTTTPSSPDRISEVINSIRPSSGLPASANPDSSQEAISKPPFNNDVDFSISRQSSLEPTNETGAGKAVDAPVGAALPEGGEEQRADGTLRFNNNEAQAQTMDPHVTDKPKDTKHDEATQSEVESQEEIEKLCTEDVVDLPEYEMAEDFLRR